MTILVTNNVLVNIVTNNFWSLKLVANKTFSCSEF